MSRYFIVVFNVRHRHRARPHRRAVTDELSDRVDVFLSPGTSSRRARAFARSLRATCRVAVDF